MTYMEMSATKSGKRRSKSSLPRLQEEDRQKCFGGSDTPGAPAKAWGLTYLTWDQESKVLRGRALFFLRLPHRLSGLNTDAKNSIKWYQAMCSASLSLFETSFRRYTAYRSLNDTRPNTRLMRKISTSHRTRISMIQLKRTSIIDHKRTMTTSAYLISFAATP